MSEAEQPTPQEVDAENPTVSKVKEATESVWKNAKGVAKEYADIRKEMDSRLDWHGGGVYRRWVKDIDAISTSIINKNKKNPLRYIAAGINSGVGRLWAAPGSLLIATLDIPYNIITYPARKISAFPPKDLIKRAFLTVEDTLTGGILALRGASRVAEASSNVQRAAVETVLTAPEIAVTMAKRRVDAITQKILHPGEAAINAEQAKKK